MPENDPKSPGSAPQSVGSAAAGSAPAASGDAGKGAAPAADAITARLEALEKALTSERQNAANLRSLHDRQMNDLRTALTMARSRASASSASSGGSQEYVDPGSGNGEAPARDPLIEQELALIKFRQLHGDWQEYWNEMEPILSDRYKAAPYAVHRGDGSVDYYRSIEFLKTSLERDRLLKLKAEVDQARATANANRDARKRDAVVSGQGSTDAEGPDFSKMTRKEKMEYLYKTQPELFDPDDLPSVLREG